MKRRVIVGKNLAIRLSIAIGDLEEVGGSLGGVLIETHDNTTSVLTSNGNVEENLLGDHGRASTKGDSHKSESDNNKEESLVHDN
jgi:hypothetical protein